MERFSASDDGGPCRSKRCECVDYRPEGEGHEIGEQEADQVVAEEENAGEGQLANDGREGDGRILPGTLGGRRASRFTIEASRAIPIGSRRGSIPVFITDLDAFDCSICLEPLSLPVYQCEDGHTACTLCCLDFKSRCPSCNLTNGYNRCRAIERFLESIQIPCVNKKHGCNATLKCSERLDHARICDHSPFPCPCTGCGFLGSSEKLSRHMIRSHPCSFQQFLYYHWFPVRINLSNQFLVLKEQQKGELFILRNSAVPLGNMLAVSRFCSNPSMGEVSYELMATTGDCTITLFSTTGNSSGQGKSIGSKGFLLVPKCFTSSSQYLKLGLQIWNKIV